MICVDLCGERFTRLTVMRRLDNLGSCATWECLCDCGNTIRVATAMLKNGNTRSCGCLKNDLLKERRFIHGDCLSRVYHAWKGMKSRCLNHNYQHYKDYGGRGIYVCEEWMEYLPFREWALTNGYSEELTLDRIDVNGNYEPSNCRWATWKVQQNNKRNNVNVIFRGEEMTVEQMSIATGIPRTTISYRKGIGLTGDDLWRYNRKGKGKEI